MKNEVLQELVDSGKISSHNILDIHKIAKEGRKNGKKS